MHPNKLDLCLELLVPHKYFMNTGVSFILLPGIEQSDDNWEDIAKHTLFSSATAVITLNKTRMAHRDNEAFVDMLIKDLIYLKKKVIKSYAQALMDVLKDNGDYN